MPTVKCFPHHFVVCDLQDERPITVPVFHHKSHLCEWKMLNITVSHKRCQLHRQFTVLVSCIKHYLPWILLIYSLGCLGEVVPGLHVGHGSRSRERWMTFDPTAPNATPRGTCTGVYTCRAMTRTARRSKKTALDATPWVEMSAPPRKTRRKETEDGRWQRVDRHPPSCPR